MQTSAPAKDRPVQKPLIGVPRRRETAQLPPPVARTEPVVSLDRRRPLQLADGRVVRVTEFLARVIEQRSREQNPDPLSDEARRLYLDELIEAEKEGQKLLPVVLCIDCFEVIPDASENRRFCDAHQWRAGAA